MKQIRIRNLAKMEKKDSLLQRKKRRRKRSQKTRKMKTHSLTLTIANLAWKLVHSDSVMPTTKANTSNFARQLSERPSET